MMLTSRPIDNSARLVGATVARLTPDQKVARSNRARVKHFAFLLLVLQRASLSRSYGPILSEIGHREGLQRRVEPRLNSERPKLLRNAPSEVGKEAANRNAATNTRRGAFTLFRKQTTARGTLQ